MSNFAKLWKETQKELGKNLRYDRAVKKRGPIKDPETAKWLIGRLFLGYVRVVDKLDECYNQIVHPQKRDFVRMLLELSLGRLLEIKREIAAIEMDDYVFFDGVLTEMQMIPDDLQIRVPEFYWRDREKSKAHQRNLISEAYEEIKREEFKREYLSHFPEEERETVWEEYLQQKQEEKLEEIKREEIQRKRRAVGGEDTTLADAKSSRDQLEEDRNEIGKAVLLVQRHERARQARRTIPIVKRKKNIRETGKKYANIPEDEAERCAAVIQKYWRRHWARILNARNLEKQMLFLGMIIPSWRDMSRFDKIREAMKLKRALQDRSREEYENASEKFKEKLTAFYSVSMNEDITDEIRGWFQSFFLATEDLPDYPGEKLVIPTGEILGIPNKISKQFIEKNFPQNIKVDKNLRKKMVGLSLAGIRPIGGSALVVAGHWIQPEDYLIVRKEMERLKKGGAKDSNKKLSDEEKAAQKKKEKSAEKRRIEAEAAEGVRLHDSNFLAPIDKTEKEYRRYSNKLDECDNGGLRYVYDLIKDEKCYELSLQVRQVVDEAMRLELELLKEALQRDKNPRKKMKRRKKRKGKKKRKRKTKKNDPTGRRTHEEMFIELFKNGIIRECEEAHLENFYGERSYTAFEFRRNFEDGPPSTGDVRDLILQLCILPLGSSTIHQLSPVIRSVCLLGPEHSGKEFLARIVCTETASVLFDLTPENTAGKYSGKAELKMLVHLVKKMSRVLQPSVILVDGAEKLFYRKVPGAEKEYEPKRLGRSLTKIVRAIKQGDQVLVIGVSSHPWLCPKRKLIKTYDAFIYVPRPDYGTYYVLWQTLLTPYHSLARDFDFSCLAKASTGYSVKVVADVVKRVMTPARIARSRGDPYKPAEFLEELLKSDRIGENVLKKCNKFYDKTPQRKRRLKMLREVKVRSTTKGNRPKKMNTKAGGRQKPND